MEKSLSIYLVDKNSRSFFSLDNVLGVDMPAANELKIWYTSGATATFTLSGSFAPDINTPADYLSEVIATAVVGENVLQDELVGVTDLAGNDTKLLSVVLAGPA